jgi:hypothetical protein
VTGRTAAPGALLATLLAAATPGQHLLLRGPEPPIVAVGEPAAIDLELADGGLADLAPLPAADGLQLAAGPPQAVATTVVRDGALQTAAARRWRVTVRALREGSFELPPFLVHAGGRELQSRRARLECARDRRGAEFAFAEVQAPPPPLFAGSRVRLVLRLCFDQALLREGMLQLFPQALDVPVQVEAPWLLELPGAVAAPAAGAPPPGLPRAQATLVLDGELARAVAAPAVEREGRPFAVFELERDFVLGAPGLLHVPAPLLRFAWATQFRDDPLAGRVPLDRQQGRVLGTALDLQIEPLPAAGRPADFAGAVGRFTLRASAKPLELAVGDSLALELAFAGTGNLTLFPPPPLDDLRGLRVRGHTERLAADARTIVYDLAVADEAVFEMPAIALPYFDPAARAFATARTEPIPLRVRRRVGAATAPPPAAPAAGPGATALLCTAALAALAVAAAAARRNRRARGRPGGGGDGGDGGA